MREADEEFKRIVFTGARRTEIRSANNCFEPISSRKNSTQFRKCTSRRSNGSCSTGSCYSSFFSSFIFSALFSNSSDRFDNVVAKMIEFAVRGHRSAPNRCHASGIPGRSSACTYLLDIAQETTCVCTVNPFRDIPGCPRSTELIATR